MHILTEAANWLWLQQQVNVSALARHLEISPRAAQKILVQLETQTIVKQQPSGWTVTPMPAHFFQKKGRSLGRTLTIYQRPRYGSQVIGVIAPHVDFLTHQQRSSWWLVCNSQGRIGYIDTEALRLVQLDAP